MSKSLVSCRVRRIILLLLIAVTLYAMYRYSSVVLTSDSRSRAADYTLIAELRSGPCFRAAVDQWTSGTVDGILMYVNEPRRLVLLGAVPSDYELGRKKLLKDGVVPRAILAIDGISRSDWDTARHLGTWLDEHPDKRVGVLCDRFSSRRWSLIFERVLKEPARSRVFIEGVADPRFNDSDWWRNRSGIKSYFFHALALAYARLLGEDSTPVTDWSVEKYESAILK